MSISSNFSNILETDLKWREEELAALKKTIFTTNRNSIMESALLRGAWALLYSHYEGFCKFSWDAYLEEIEKNNIKRTDCIPCISILSLAKRFSILRGNISDQALWDLFQTELPNLQNDPAKFEKKLETNSNLWPCVFIKNTEKLGIEPSQINELKIKIRTLVSRRNEIAHGKKMLIKNREEYFDYEDNVLVVMHDLALCLIEAVDNEHYKL